MFRILLLIALVSSCFSTFATEFGADYCSSYAQTVVQSQGGDLSTLRLRYSSTDGFGVNMFGYSAYTFQRGAETCFISYTVFGTYMGSKCSASSFACKQPKRSRR